MKTAAIVMTMAMMAAAEDQRLCLWKSCRAKRSSLLDASSSSGDWGVTMNSALCTELFSNIGRRHHLTLCRTPDARPLIGWNSASLPRQLEGPQPGSLRTDRIRLRLVGWLTAAVVILIRESATVKLFLRFISCRRVAGPSLQSAYKDPA